MKSRYILASAILLASSASMLAERQTCYARSGQNVMFSVVWGADNYGDIQWQVSNDGGNTWTDIKDATTPFYSVRPEASALYRAVITGDPSCPPVVEERELKLVDLNSTVETLGYNFVELDVDASALKDANVVEYGFTATIQGLNRNYTLLPRNKVGEGMPGEKFRMRCEGLVPATSYSIRPYLKTADGSVVFGGGKLAETTDGVKFDTEDWAIEKTSLRIPFTVTNESAVKDPELWLGEDINSLRKLSLTNSGGGKYSAFANRLQPGTEYHLVLKATIDGTPIQVEKTARTMSDYSRVEVDETVIPVSHVVEWDNTNLICLTPETLQVEYPRMCRVDENKILLTYHGGSGDHWKNSYLRKSYDNGRTWTDPVMIYDASTNFYGSGFYRICNPEMTKLQNGWIILTTVANANPETNANCKVLACISKDGGETWSDPIIVGRERTWEPMVVQMPNGELELLVSSEGDWWGKGGYTEQRIVSARSTDNGETWTSYESASYKPGARDGMPVAVVMQGNKGVVFVEESVNGGVPPTIQYRTLDGKYDSGNWNGTDSNKRWRVDKLNGGSGAPYMIQLPTGEFLIMAHSNQTGSVWQTCRPTVVMADNTCHNFAYSRVPLANALPSQCGAYYNSFFLYDNDTVWLLFTKAQYSGDTRKESDVMMMQGKIVERLP